MKRRLFNLATVGSLLLLLLAAALLGYSALMDASADLRVVGRSRTYALSHWQGTVHFQVIGPFPSDYPSNRNSAWASDPRVPGRTLGFGFTTGPYPMGHPPVPIPLKFLQVPAAFIVLVLAAMPVAALLGIVVRRHRTIGGRGGHCAACGYDLRESPDRCPECGTVNPAAVQPE